MAKQDDEIAVFVDDIDRVGEGAELKLSMLPSEPSGRRAILLKRLELAAGGGVIFIAGLADAVVKHNATLTFEGVSRLAIPIVVGFGENGGNVRPDLFACKGWGPRDFVYVSSGTVTRIEAEVAALLIHRTANGLE